MRNKQKQREKHSKIKQCAEGYTIKFPYNESRK